MRSKNNLLLIAKESLLLRRSYFIVRELSSSLFRENNFSAVSCAFLTTSSAAAEGVGALKEAAKSVKVKSVSCPTQDIIGILLAATARTTSSSLKLHKSSMESTFENFSGLELFALWSLRPALKRGLLLLQDCAHAFLVRKGYPVSPRPLVK